MKKVPFTNESDSIVYAPDGQRVMPGDTRMIEVADDAPDSFDGEDAIAALAQGKAGEIITALAGLSGEDVDRLLELERAADKPRKTVIEACELRKLELLDAEEQARKEAEAAAALAAGSGEAGGNAE